MEDLEVVVLTRDINECGLKRGDVGTIVHSYDREKAYEVEFVTAQGTTVSVMTLKPSEIRPIENREILHVREIGTAAA